MALSEDFKIYGYARVSGPGQDLDLQLEMLTAAGCDQVFAEKASAAKGKARPQLAKLLAALQPGDVMLVKSLTRAARSTRDALQILDAVVARGAVFRSMDEPWADMTTPAGEFMTTLMSAFSEFDRKMILQRTSEGRQFAKARGGRMGRKRTLSPAQERFAVDERAKVPPMSFDDLSALLKVSVSTLKRVVARAEAIATPSYQTGGPQPFRPIGGRPQIDIEELTARAAEGAVGDRPLLSPPPANFADRTGEPLQLGTGTGRAAQFFEDHPHPPSCAVHTSGLGNTRRCTCGRGPDGPLRGG